jgi:Cu(I)/Ag(I) efflux system membrane protein CusA/SilA
MEVIKGLKENIKKISPGLPLKTLKDGTISQLTIVPFYDRSELIGETLQTLGDTLGFEILITILVVLVMLLNLRVSILISSLMPIVVLMVFISMKFFGVDANILALSGIAIAIGTMVDMGIILTENIVRHLESAGTKNTEKTVYRATKEVSGAILTAGLTTIISFLPVFSLSGAEGKLFTPLAFTKTVALSASMFVALLIIPPLAVVLFRKYSWKPKLYLVINYTLLFTGLILTIFGKFIALILIAFGILGVLKHSGRIREKSIERWKLLLGLVSIVVFLGILWRPLGITVNILKNIVFVGLLSFLILAIFYYFKKHYTRNLIWALENKLTFLSIPVLFLLLGFGIWSKTEKEFMPSLDEGSFMLMPTSMPHAGISEIKQTLMQLDIAVSAMPEVKTVVGKAGRVESALDPAPLSMYENLVVYKPEYITGPGGKPMRFRTNEAGLFETRDGRYLAAATGLDSSDLTRDRSGEFYRNWRPHIRSREDIWNEIIQQIRLPGLTSTPKLQPIETRLVMLQSGLRAPMGIKVKGQDLNEIEAFGLELEAILKEVDGINPMAVFADRIVGKPYLEVDIDRGKISRYGLSVDRVQQAIETAVGGKLLTQTVEGRERYGVRVRYPRELRGSPEDLGSIYITLEQGGFVPLQDLVSIDYRKGPQHIKSEDSFLIGYVLFDKADGVSEVTAVERAREQIENRIRKNELYVPKGITYEFSGTFENQQRAQKKLLLVLPLVLVIIFLILYLQFRSVSVSLFVFAGVAVAFAGGFLLIWFYGQPWFMDFGVGDINFRELFRIKAVNLSVAVWVGFIALFGIATDDGVVMATYLDQAFRKNKPLDVASVRASVVEAGNKRIRPCLMTTATTLLALLPILTSTGRGSDVMIPMAIPCFGGMLIALITLFVVPVLYSWKKEAEV